MKHQKVRILERILDLFIPGDIVEIVPEGYAHRDHLVCVKYKHPDDYKKYDYNYYGFYLSEGLKGRQWEYVTKKYWEKD